MDANAVSAFRDLIELRDGLRRLEAEHALSDDQAIAIRDLVAEINTMAFAASGELQRERRRSRAADRGGVAGQASPRGGVT